MIARILTFTALLVTASAAAVECLDADFECARVPAHSGAALWAPPAGYGGWQFSVSAGVVNTVADDWRGPRADDGTQIAGLRGAQAGIAQLLHGWDTGAVYHLRWSEAAPAPSSCAWLAVAVRAPNGAAVTGMVVRTLVVSNGWARKEAVFRADEDACTIAFVHCGTVPDAASYLDRVRIWRTPPTPPACFPRFSVPGFERDMELLRELFFRHYRSSLMLATFNIHWLGEALLWPALPAFHEYAWERRAARETAAFTPVFSQRAWTRQRLATAVIAPDGYVSSQQHEGLGHPDGWPFPCWWQSGGAGWHFMPHAHPGLAPWLATPAAFRLRGMTTVACATNTGWRMRLTAPQAWLEFPTVSVQGVAGSFVLLKWSVSNMPAHARCALEFRTAAQPLFSRAQRIPVPLPAIPGAATQAWLALLGHPRWHTNDILTGLRLVFDAAPGAELTLAYACTAVDTRHNNNNPIFIEACHAYAAWSGDTNFLAGAMPRLRLALRYALDEFAVRTNACVVTPWLGHDGTSGLTFDARGNKIIRNGDGIGNNYFDLLPFGGRDVYATIYLYRALKKMAALEEAVARHAEWHIAAPPAALAPRALRQLAHLLAVNNTQFWNEATGRFGTRDGNGVLHDYGFTFLACEAVSSGYASSRQAEQIMQWLDGTRIVAGDTSTGADMYRWEFAPRATTRRNTDYYTYSWPYPETIPFGGQVQDGGAVLCFSYHDLMTRLRTRGPDNAWQRLRAITDWLGRVQAEGGYREYYYGGTVATRGTLQGGGPAGGLGLDCEFFESVLMPQVLLYGFMGVQPRLDGLVVRPRLPRAWPALTITGIQVHNTTLDLTARPRRIAATVTAGTDALRLYPPHASWDAAYYAGTNAAPVCHFITHITRAQASMPLRTNASTRVVLIRKNT